MQENKYDDLDFFNRYKKMARSVNGLEAAGEWHELRGMLPNFRGKRVLDLGCGFGWHCRYAEGQGAESVVGIDLSANMLEEARAKTNSSRIEYRQLPIEAIDFPDASFDVVISSLVFHYLQSFSDICNKVAKCLSSKGDFVFSVEHPIFTAQGSQQWHRNANGEPMHWPVDHYFAEGERKAVFLGKELTKYHKTVTTYVNTLIQRGFELTTLVEPTPPDYMMQDDPSMQNELRRPMMLLIAARKK